MAAMCRPHERKVEWKGTLDPERPYEAWVDGKHWQIRANKIWPERLIYSFLIDGKLHEKFDHWPEVWTRPSLEDSPGDSEEEREFKKRTRDREVIWYKEDFWLEMEKEERNRDVMPWGLSEEVSRKGEEYRASLRARGCGQHGPCPSCGFSYAYDGVRCDHCKK